MRRTVLVAAALWLGLSLTAAACTFFSFAGEDLVLFGNSEDHDDENTLAWYVPGTAEAYGCLFIGFDTGFAQGGMNAAGLAFDAAGISASPLVDHPELPTPDPLNFCETVLRRCATVDEAIALIASYNLSYVRSAQFQFTDRSGASVIVAPGPEREIAFVRSESAFQVTTNINVAIYPVAHKSCSRHRTATRALERIEAKQAVLSVDAFVEILAAVAIRSGSSETMYSNVFDLTNAVAYLYHRHDFGRVAALAMDDLAAAGDAVTYRIDELTGAVE